MMARRGRACELGVELRCQLRVVGLQDGRGVGASARQLAQLGSSQGVAVGQEADREGEQRVEEGLHGGAHERLRGQRRDLRGVEAALRRLGGIRRGPAGGSCKSDGVRAVGRREGCVMWGGRLHDINSAQHSRRVV
jgi:hypothetical protein